MNKKLKILIAEHDKNDLEIIEYELTQGGIMFESKYVQNENDYSNALSHFIPDIILSDYSFPTFDGPTAFKIREELAPDTPFIFVSGTIGEEKAVEEIKRGVTDYTSKNTLYTLCYKIERAIKDARRRKEKEFTDKLLIENERRFRTLIENSTDIKTLTSKEGRITYSSPSLTTALGFSLEEYSDKYPSEIIHPDDLQNYLENKNEILKNPGKSFHFEQRRLHKNGNWIWVEGIVTNMLHEPAINALVSNIRDITERKVAEEAIIKSENEIRTMAESMPQIVWVTTADGKNIFFNQQWIDYTGLTLEESYGDGWLIPFHEDDKPLPWSAWNSAVINLVEYTVECRLRKYDGSYHWWLMRGVPKINERGEIEKWYGTCTDIEGIKEKEKEIKKNESFTKGILNSLRSHIAVIDSSGNIIAVNESWKQFSLENGETALERTGVGSNYFSVCEKAISSGDKIASEALSSMKKVFTQENYNLYLEYPCDSPDTPRWFSMHGMKFESDEPMIVVSHTDITERKLTEEKLIQSETYLAEAQRLAKMGSWNFDMKTDKLTWSEELYNVFDTDMQTFTETHGSFLHLIDEEDREAASQTSRHTQKTGEPFAIEYNITTAKGEKRVIQEYGYGEKDKSGNVTRLFGTAQDITERKLAEKEREKMVSDIMQRSKNLEQFTYIISHNLRAPIVNILGLSNILKGDISEKDKDRTQKYLFNAIEKLDEITKDLNKILQTKSEITESKELVDFEGLVSSIKMSLENVIEKENVRILTNFRAIKKITVVKSYIHSIFYNLILNAIKYRQVSKEPVIAISTELNNGELSIIFKDNGTGINLKEHGDKVFGLYKRFHPHIEGKGLGLFMVRTQVEVLGGKISVKSEPGAGTEFTIELPYENGESIKMKEL